jgi:hypothetical protein
LLSLASFGTSLTHALWLRCLQSAAAGGQYCRQKKTPKRLREYMRRAAFET